MQTKIEFEEEIWKPVEDFENRFKISNYGRLISMNGRHKGERAMKPTIGKKEGYYIVKLRKPGIKKDVRIHTMVANAFVKKKNPNHKVVNHLDTNKLNNYYKNLEWTDHKGNSEHAVKTGLHNIKGEKHPQCKRTNELIYQIRFCYPEINNTHLGKKLNISREQIRDIRKNRFWKHITEDFFYSPISSISTSLGV